jgi:integrase
MNGHIRQRSAGSWEVRYRAAGKIRTATVRGGKRDAERRLRELLTLVDQNRHPDDPERLTVERWLDRWLGIVKTELATQTHLGYESAVRVHIAPAIGDRQLVRLAPVDIQAFYTGLSAGHIQASTARRIATVLSAALNRAVELRLIPNSPATAVRKRRPRPPSVPETPAVLDREQCEALIAEARGSDIYIAVLLGLATGMRRNEILALRWGQIDLAVGLIRVAESIVHIKGETTRKTPKSGQTRIVTIPPEVVADLRTLKAEQAEALLRLGVRQDNSTEACRRGADGYMRTPRALSSAFTTLAKHAGMPACNFHVMRHSHASELLRLGAPVHAVAARLGHRDGGALLLKTYAHVTDAVARDAAARLGSLFAKL